MKKTISEPKPQIDPQDAAAAAIADELGALDTELAPFKTKYSRAESLRKALREICKDREATSQFVFEGDNYVVTLGAKSNEKFVRLAAAFKALGKVKFITACSMTIKAITEAVAPEVLPSLVGSEQTGSRNISIQHKGKPE
jgi:hypothetical protein